MIRLRSDHEPLLHDMRQASGCVRVLLLVSPTWPMCLAGASGAGAELLAAEPHPDLRVYYVWVPMLPPDDEAAADAVAARFAEPRALHYWDGERRLARELATALRISARDSIGAGAGPGFAWDVYLAYAQGALDLARPAFWMHQLAATHAPRLDAAVFREQVRRLLVAPPPTYPAEGQA